MDPIEVEFHDSMNALAFMLDGFFNGEARGDERKVGFVLLAFNFGDKGRVNYISNADREDMVATMKSFIARAEGRAIDEVGHG